MSNPILIDPTQVKALADFAQQLLALSQSAASAAPTIAAAAPPPAVGHSPNVASQAVVATPIAAVSSPSTSPDNVQSAPSALTAAAAVPFKADAPLSFMGVLESTRRGFDVFALWPLLIAAIALSGIVYWFAPAKLLVISFGLAKLTLFGLGGALVDYLLFPSDAPEDLKGIEQGTAWKRRALIVAASILSGGQLV